MIVEGTAGATAAGLGMILGTAAGGPVGTVLGGALGAPVLRVFRRLEGELVKRGIGAREERRISRTWTVALTDIEQRLRAGDTPRDEYRRGDSENSAADDLLEEITKAVEDSPDDRLADPQGHLFASLIFAASPEHARFMAGLARRLSYLDLRCIAAVAPSDEWGKPNAYAKQRSQYPSPRLAPGASYTLQLTPRVEATLDNLSGLGLVGIKDSKKATVVKPEQLWGSGEEAAVWSTSPQRIRPTKLGDELATLMRLDEIRTVDAAGFLDDLWPVSHYLCATEDSEPRDS